jgi:hypothetical protein
MSYYIMYVRHPDMDYRHHISTIEIDIAALNGADEDYNNELSFIVHIWVSPKILSIKQS